MSDKKKSQEPYDVGYGKPPKHSQWQEGQSGNPSGKKKKDVSLHAKLKKLAAKEIVVQQNGVPVTMTQAEVMFAAIFNKAMNGDLGCTKFISQALGVDPHGLPAVSTPELSQNLLDALETHADWVSLIETAKSDLAEAAEADNDGGNDGSAC